MLVDGEDTHGDVIEDELGVAVIAVDRHTVIMKQLFQICNINGT